MNKRVIEFEHPAELQETYRLLKMAFDLQQEIKKYQLRQHNIQYEELDDLIWVSMDQKSIAAIDVDPVLGNTEILELCERILGIKHVE